MAIALTLMTGWILVSAALAFGISKAIAVADRIELGDHDGR